MPSDLQVGGQTYSYAGFWWRFLAALIDAPIRLVIGFLIGVVVGVFMGASHANADQTQGVSALIGIVVEWLYYAIFESSAMRATPGKAILGIRVVDESGDRIGFGRATGRHFAKILSALILFFGFFMIGWTRKKQGLHDMISGCLVVKQRQDNIGRISLPA